MVNGVWHPCIHDHNNTKDLQCERQQNRTRPDDRITTTSSWQTWAETSLRLVSPFPEGWSTAEVFTIRSRRPKLPWTRSAAPRMSSSWFTSSLRTVTLSRCCSAKLRSSAAPSGFRHVAITVTGVLFFKICRQNSSPIPLLEPWTSATGTAMSAVHSLTAVMLIQCTQKVFTFCNVCAK